MVEPPRVCCWVVQVPRVAVSLALNEKRMRAELRSTDRAWAWAVAVAVVAHTL
jgi:hypothetical protein